jgi:hypothetical protein
MGLSKSFSRSTARSNFGFYRPTLKVKTKIKRYLYRALPNISLLENALKHRVTLVTSKKNQNL